VHDIYFVPSSEKVDEVWSIDTPLKHLVSLFKKNQFLRIKMALKQSAPRRQII